MCVRVRVCVCVCSPLIGAASSCKAASKYFGNLYLAFALRDRVVMLLPEDNFVCVCVYYHWPLGPLPLCLCCPRRAGRSSFVSLALAA